MGQQRLLTASRGEAQGVEVEGALGTADFGDNGRYRYSLTRQWGDRGISGDGLLWVMLNPSTATADRNDPTLRKIIGFTKRLGNKRLRVVNLYGLVATKPADLYRAEDPVGPENDAHIALSSSSRSVRPPTTRTRRSPPSPPRRPPRSSSPGGLTRRTRRGWRR